MRVSPTTPWGRTDAFLLVDSPGTQQASMLMAPVPVACTCSVMLRLGDRGFLATVTIMGHDTPSKINLCAYYLHPMQVNTLHFGFHLGNGAMVQRSMYQHHRLVPAGRVATKIFLIPFF